LPVAAAPARRWAATKAPAVRAGYPATPEGDREEEYAASVVQRASSAVPIQGPAVADPAATAAGSAGEPGPGGLRAALNAGAFRLGAFCSLLVGLLVFAQLAGARTAANPSLDVTFAVNGTISVALPDGTPVGSSSGAPTLIPAGFYTVQLSAPGECVQVPLFQLSGPGENIESDMSGGEVNTEVYNTDLLPNSTYTWSSSASPTVVYSFTTSSEVEGAPVASAAASSPGASSAAASAVAPSEDVVGSKLSQHVVGSATVPFRGTLTGAVSAEGRLTLAFAGKSVSSLPAGRYTITVTDRSATNGFVLAEISRAATTVAGVGTVGKRSMSVDLTAGQWFYAPRLLGKKTYFVVVS
jgi:hypothetical protein